MAETNLNLVGKEWDFDLLFDGKPGEAVRGYVESGTISPRTVDFDDKIVGQDSYNIDIMRVGWEGALEVLVPNLNLARKIDLYHDLKNAHRNPPTVAFTIQAAVRDGSFQNCAFTPCTVTYKLTPGGQDAKSKMSITIKAREKIDIA